MYISKEDLRQYIALLKRDRAKLDKGLSVPSFMKIKLDDKIAALERKL